MEYDGHIYEKGWEDAIKWVLAMIRGEVPPRESTSSVAGDELLEEIRYLKESR